MNTSLKSVNWTIRPYQSGDERQLVVLFERVFQQPVSEDHWRWKLKERPSPVENVWLAVDGDQAIFQYAGIPVPYRLTGGEQTAIVSVDTMASPDYRRQGLLSTVGRFTYDRWQEAGVPFVIGLPNEQWGSRAERLGWQKLFPLQWLIRPLAPQRALARRWRLPLLARFDLAGRWWNAIWNRQLRPDPAVRVSEVDYAGAAFDALWQRCGATVLFSVVRDSGWVNWRYLEPPAFTYHVLLAERDGRPAGYLAYRLDRDGERSVGFIAELFTLANDEGARATLLRTAVHRLHCAGAELVAALAVPETTLHSSFRRAGFRFSWGAFTVQLVPLAPDLPLVEMQERKNWVIQGGDFDVV